MPAMSKVMDGKKYMWDGEEYPDHGAAEAKASEYKKDNFEVQVVEEDGKHYVYSRRVVTEIVVEGQP
jgi:hypothetical protein